MERTQTHNLRLIVTDTLMLCFTGQRQSTSVLQSHVMFHRTETEHQCPIASCYVSQDRDRAQVSFSRIGDYRRESSSLKRERSVVSERITPTASGGSVFPLGGRWRH